MENDSLKGLINTKYLNQIGFYPINDSVFTTKNNEQVLIFQYKLDDPKFYQVSINYLLDSTINLNRFLERCGDNAMNEYKKTNSFFIEETYSKDVKHFSLLIQKNKEFQGKKYADIQYNFKKNLINDEGKPYRWFKYENNLSESFPFQNTVWYFDTKVIKEKKDSDGDYRVITEIYFSQAPKYPNKIEFVNDIDFIVNYTINNVVKKIKGDYNTEVMNGNFNQEQDIRFNIEVKNKTVSNPKTIVKKGKIPLEEKVQEIQDVEYLGRISELKVGTVEFLKSLFSNGYEISYDKSYSYRFGERFPINTDIVLTHIDKISENNFAPIPGPVYKSTDKK